MKENPIKTCVFKNNTDVRLYIYMNRFNERLLINSE